MGLFDAGRLLCVVCRFSGDALQICPPRRFITDIPRTPGLRTIVYCSAQQRCRNADVPSLQQKPWQPLLCESSLISHLLPGCKCGITSLTGHGCLVDLCEEKHSAIWQKAGHQHSKSPGAASNSNVQPYVFKHRPARSCSTGLSLALETRRRNCQGGAAIQEARAPSLAPEARPTSSRGLRTKYLNEGPEVK